MAEHYKLVLALPEKVTDLQFPDITKLQPLDRDYDLLRERRDGGRNLSESDRTRLQLRSQFYEDLGVASLEEYCLGTEKDSYGTLRRSDTLEGRGISKVLQAIRTFTTDVDLINYRLDVQDDLSVNPQLVSAMTQFYEKALEAGEMNLDAYAIDHNRHRMRDQWGRYVYKKWDNLPKSFAILDAAIDEFDSALENTKSQGMRDVRDFLNAIRGHPIYQGWTKYAGMVHEGGRYFVAFEYEPVDGAKVVIQIGPVMPQSKIDQLLSTLPNADGKLPHDLGEEVIVRRVTGLIRNEFGHLISELTGLNFEPLATFCDVLTRGMQEQFSFYAALGKMYREWDKVGIEFSRPLFGQSDGVEMTGVIHPTIAAIAKKKDGYFMLNDYNTNSKSNGIVVTGPNDGGKTASGKAFGLAIVLAQAGIRVPAKYFRMEKPVGEVYTHFIIKEEVDDGKGRHKNELTRARKLCELLTPDDFLLFDEPCGGTDVPSGLQDSLSLLGYANQMNLPFIFTTHLHDLAKIVDEGRFVGIRNMQVEVLQEEEGNLVLTHQLIPGRAKESYGWRVSQEVGVTVEQLNTLLQQRISKGTVDPSKLRGSQD